MSSLNGFIFRIFQAIPLFLLLMIPQKTDCQEGILDSVFTFRAGSVKTSEALDIISGQTGYNFTYDSRLIDKEVKTEMNFNHLRLGIILDSIFQNNTLAFSVIDKYIIISRSETIHSPSPDTLLPEMVSYITGIIVDEENSEPLPFATIGLKNKGRGTVTNNNGEFGLKITPDLYNDTLSVSYLGYIRSEIPVRQAFRADFSIPMKREFISIPEIIIRNQIPQEIINKTVLAIRRNYSNDPVQMTGFYREGVLKKKELQNYSEAIVQIFKTSYTGSLLGDQMKIFRSRKIENIKRTDTLAVRLKAGLSTCLELDGVRHLFDFLNRESMSDYRYRLSDIVTWEDESAYAIEFEQKEDIDQPLYKGMVYINTVDFAILHAEFELNPALIHKMKESFISNSSKGFNTWPLSVKYSVSYRKINDIYFLSHVRGDLMFSSKQKKKLFNSQYLVFFELAITDIVQKNVRRFEREELAPIHSVFSRTITSYDQDFWGNQDFLRPEDNLLKALKNMKVRLQEFSE
ncbi:MAG: carboxypeptidase-like regulatory domain-containing protein [Bacteroidales bacterium]|nr:carboxypeptidase-like regulatory domain-containing protein [Bacteroidales bacterium]